MAVKTLDDLFVHTLKDILYAERKIVKALPKMERKASSAKLKELFSSHLEETENQISRLEQVFEVIGKPARAAKCDAILGLTEEAEDLMDEVEDPETLDAALIAMAQAVEHYELARYGALVAWAKRLGHDKAVPLLEATLDEEYGADRKLSKLAETSLNQKAA